MAVILRFRHRELLLLIYFYNYLSNIHQNSDIILCIISRRLHSTQIQQLLSQTATSLPSFSFCGGLFLRLYFSKTIIPPHSTLSLVATCYSAVSPLLSCFVLCGEILFFLTGSPVLARGALIPSYLFHS